MQLDYGLAPDDFAARHADRAPLLVRGALKDHGFGWPQLDAALQLIDPVPQNLQLHNAGQIDPQQYLEPAQELGLSRLRLVKERFYALLRGGATMVLNRVEAQSPEARQLCAAVSRYAGAPSISNAYLSFGGKGTFGQHWDTHDVHALQLIGRKRWRVYEPTFLHPLAQHDSGALGMKCPDKPVIDCVLEPGDLLYIPRGWWHETTAFEEPSFHLAVGIYPPTLHDFLMWAVARQAPARAAIRGGVPKDPAAAASSLGAAVDALRELLLDPDMLSLWRKELAVGDRPLPAFELSLLAGERRLDADTLLRLNSVHAPLREQGGIGVNGRSVPEASLGGRILAQLGQAPMLTPAMIAAQLPDAAMDAVLGTLREMLAHDLVVLVSA